MTDHSNHTDDIAAFDAAWLTLADIPDNEWGWPLNEVRANSSISEPPHGSQGYQNDHAVTPDETHSNAQSEENPDVMDISTENASEYMSDDSYDLELSFARSEGGGGHLIVRRSNGAMNTPTSTPNSLPSLVNSPMGYASDNDGRSSAHSMSPRANGPRHSTPTTPNSLPGIGRPASPTFNDTSDDSLPEVIFAVDGTEERINEEVQQAALI